jgi:1-acyl-sn-glycerol-3-phosphate acyltransferase
MKKRTATNCFYVMLMTKKTKKITAFHKALTLFILVAGSIFILFIAPFVALNDKLFGRYRGWNYNYLIFKRVFDIGYFLSGIRFSIRYEMPHDRRRKYVFVLNHISFIDIPVMMSAIRQPVRILGKEGPHKIPVFGYYYRKSTVMVNRNSPMSRGKSLDTLRHYLRKGVSIVICPEGTFNMGTTPLKEFYEGAFRMAIETQTNIKPIVMPDTHDRLYYYGLSLEPGRCRVIYLPEVEVQGMTTADIPRLKEKVYKMMEDALVRYKASWIQFENVQNLRI